MSKTVAPPYSRSLNPWIYLGIPIAVAIVLVLLELTSLDMDIAKMAYDPVSGEFIGRHSHFLEDVLHDRAKQMVMAFGALAIIGFAASFKVERLIPWRRELGCLVLSMALSTAFVTPVKVVTSVQCPWSLKEFGGEETYSELLSPRPATEKPGRCWPGGHAATGFTLFALFFVLRDRRPRLAKAGLALAFGLGSIFSVGRMLQGAHFFSHNIWTAVFCWLICLGVYYFVLYRPAPKQQLASETQATH
ncbi:phosphatase PAP2 family protein [Pseudomonas cannabina]|uniref:Phosphoesterase n=3 Tax=Pseudomonas syringae group TaxID=136849 RepID=A0A3M3QHP4_PSECA|nr:MULTISPECIES: phosphatase PAP2 family protein [Pseudomonas syringae group]KPB73028.1 Phosphoesterase [Pseudomonas syringae pv. maculicola]KPW26371.1 Phosphoesterase [Pseudomonas cannabina pv. alisalensis]MBM0138779.1 phosphatase PAP2 family protein [Pseudomonas cannabina pv. alisalensis]QHE98849.1 phosphatase PAP2 family protein [Pseudomonas syringae pv. maculicola str. ES4326]QQN21111.1 phosphatase PAP2 family protein [Pseudomonas cannabina pv. alisalensis]